MKRDGFSLIELLVAMVVLGIVAAWGTVNYKQWRNKYDMETQVRETYTDLTNLRLMAKSKSTSHFMSFAANQVKANEDTDLNGALNGGDKVLCLWNLPTGQSADPACPDAVSVSAGTLNYPITWSGSTTLTFDTRGLAGQNETICINYAATPQVNAAYDCVDVSSTRIALGAMINKQGACDSANCGKKK